MNNTLCEHQLTAMGSFMGWKLTNWTKDQEIGGGCVCVRSN